MEILNFEDFFLKTTGGRPCQADMSIYVGKEFDCGCGKKHSFDQETTKVIRELPGMKFVIYCPSEEYINCVKITLFAKMKTLFASQEEESE